MGQLSVRYTTCLLIVSHIGYWELGLLLDLPPFQLCAEKRHMSKKWSTQSNRFARPEANNANRLAVQQTKTAGCTGVPCAVSLHPAATNLSFKARTVAGTALRSSLAKDNR